MRDGPTFRRRGFVLGRILEQHGVGVVDVNEELTRDAEVAEGRDRAVLAGHAHMAHALPGLAADAEPDHLVILPQRAVEEDERRAIEALLQGWRHRGTAGNEEEARAGPRVDDLKADGAAILMDARLAA